MEVTAFGREVKSPAGKLGCVVLAIPVFIAILVLAVLFLLIFLPVAIVLHPILRLFGRVGTIRTDTTTLEIHIDKRAFQRR